MPNPRHALFLAAGTGPHTPAIWFRILLSAANAELAERYVWIDRALSANALDNFVKSLARRIAKFTATGLIAVKDRVNVIALAAVPWVARALAEQARIATKIIASWPTIDPKSCDAATPRDGGDPGAPLGPPFGPLS